MAFLVGFVLGIIYGYLFEYFAHRYILHNYKKFNKAFKHHFGRHHKESRNNNMLDDGYSELLSESSVFEITSLSSSLLLHIPIIFISFGFYLALCLSAIHYYHVHRKAHRDVVWGKKNFPWHYKHHMGDQNKNFGVRSNFVDIIMRTN